MHKNDRIRATVGRVLRAEREAGHLSQERVGELAGLHRNYVAGTERGERNISIEALSAWLPVLGLTWQEFGSRVDALAQSSTRSARS